jgi:spermidine/putrescine-binding protein
VPHHAANSALAETFIDYLLDKQVSADIANYTVYGTPNQVSIDEGLIYEEYLTDPAVYPPQEVEDKLFLLVSNDAIEQLFNTTWEATSAALGK